MSKQLRVMFDLGEPRDRWEAEMIKLAIAEIERGNSYAAEVESGRPWQEAGVIGCAAFVEGLVMAIRRRREMLEDGAL